MSKTIVIDNHSSTSTVGYGGDDAPYAVYPTLDLGINGGVICDWDKMTNNWQYGFKTALCCDCSDHAVIIVTSGLTNGNYNYKEEKKIAEIMYETFKVPQLLIGKQGEFALYATNRSTGTVVQSGDTLTMISCIENGMFTHSNILYIYINYLSFVYRIAHCAISHLIFIFL